VRLGPDLVRLLLYADDLTLLAASKEQLQAMLDSLQAFSSQDCMEVNVGQCAVVVFGRTAPKPGTHVPAQGWVYNGQQVPLGQSLRYLGIVFHQTRGVSASMEALHSAGLRAMWGMLGK
jgi:hypothetical protein